MGVCAILGTLSGWAFMSAAIGWAVFWWARGITALITIMAGIVAPYLDITPAPY